MDIVELGLLYDVEVEGPKVKVIHTLTSMGCPAGPMIQEDIHDRAAAQVPGVEDVEIELTWDPPGRPSGCPTTRSSSSASASRSSARRGTSSRSAAERSASRSRCSQDDLGDGADASRRAAGRCACGIVRSHRAGAGVHLFVPPTYDASSESSGAGRRPSLRGSGDLDAGRTLRRRRASGDAGGPPGGDLGRVRSCSRRAGADTPTAVAREPACSADRGGERARVLEESAGQPPSRQPRSPDPEREVDSAMGRPWASGASSRRSRGFDLPQHGPTCGGVAPMPHSEVSRSLQRFALGSVAGIPSDGEDRAPGAASRAPGVPRSAQPWAEGVESTGGGPLAATPEFGRQDATSSPGSSAPATRGSPSQAATRLRALEPAARRLDRDLSERRLSRGSRRERERRRLRSRAARHRARKPGALAAASRSSRRAERRMQECSRSLRLTRAISRRSVAWPRPRVGAQELRTVRPTGRQRLTARLEAGSRAAGRPRPTLVSSAGMREHDLPELLARLQPLVRGAGLGEREDRVDHRLRAPARDQLVGALEVGARAHRRAEHVELLPPDAVERRRRVRAARRAADDDPPAGPRGLQRALPRRLADVLDDDVGAAAARRLLDRRDARRRSRG